MPEISDERLAYLEALETVCKKIVLPYAARANRDAAMERVWKYPVSLTDAEAERLMGGSAMYDDPPKGWTKKRLADYTRGYLSGREVVAGNLGQYFWRFVRALRDPVEYWKRWRLGYLDLVKDAPCEDCPGHYKIVEDEPIGIRCDTCDAFYTYQQVCEIVEREEESEREAREAKVQV